jgi:hypothetical protein
LNTHPRPPVPLLVTRLPGPRRPFGWLLLAVLTLVGCGPHHAMKAPPGFVRYEKGSSLALITADGVRVKSREERNYPKADLTFWVDAMKRHLQARGYAVQGQRCFQTTAGLPGCTLEFLLPHGAEDWVLSETTFVIADRIVLVEAAGPFDRFTKIQEGLNQSLLTFDPGQ